MVSERSPSLSRLYQNHAATAAAPRAVVAAGSNLSSVDLYCQDDSENNAPSTPGSPGFSTDRLPPNTTTSRGATDPSSYSDDDGEAEVDPNVLPDDDGAAVVAEEEEEDGEDLFNDDYLK
jgi:hypothetical protein